MRRFLVLAATIVLVMTAALPINATFRGHNGRIAYTNYSYSGGDTVTRTIKADGSGRRMLLADGLPVRAPAFSPNGERIAVGVYDEANERHLLQIIDVHGTVRSTLLASRHDIDAITWGPDGRRLAFCRSGQIWVVRRDGSALHELGGPRACHPEWSPDGRWIVLTHDACDQNGCTSRLDVVRPNGRDRHALVRDAYFADWSPSGRRMVFYRFIEVADDPGDAQGELFTIRSDGTGLQRLTFTPAWNEGAPVWSPDGKWIVYSRWPETSYTGNLMKMNLATRERVLLTNTPDLDEWVPIDWQSR